MQVLFYTRLIIYLTALAIPAFHPSIAVPYDRGGWWLWFCLVPGEMLIAFYLAPPRLTLKTWLLSAFGFLAVFCLFFSLLGAGVLLYMAVGALSFILTALIFKTGTRGYPVAAVEPFVITYLLYQLLEFSRSSEAAAAESAAMNRLILFFIFFAFLGHGMVLYFAAFHDTGRGGSRRELIIFPLIVAPVVLLAAILLPPDFVTHSVVMNILEKEPHPKPFPLDEYGQGLERGNLSGRRNLSGRPRSQDNPYGSSGSDRGDDSQGGEEGQLQGIPSDQWRNSKGETGPGGKQYAVMVVASPSSPVYAAEAYYGDFDPVEGFTLTKNDELNSLGFIRLLETWEQQQPSTDGKRYPQDIFYLSSLAGRVLAYRPRMIEPTVLDRTYHPFDYTYRTVSMVSFSGAQDWSRISGLSADDERALSSYLRIDMPDEESAVFRKHMEQAIGKKSGYYEKILALFKSFSSYQYELGFTDDVSVGRMREFIEGSRRGDCTEFSNTAAILARMAGIPSRVVTGYLAARQLQSFAHRQAVRMLRDVIKPLQQFPVQDLYLVTTAHRHSWIQLYMPGYGWVDFDPTSFAIPPADGGPNSMDVVIPIIRIEENPAPFVFPWLLFGRIMLTLVILTTISLYLFRTSWLFHLMIRARGRGSRSLSALYTLLLARLRTRGYGLKPPSQTAIEYSRRYPELLRFASVYTELRYGNGVEGMASDRMRERLRVHYRAMISDSGKPGFLGSLGRLFSLRGLYYL